MLATRDRSGLTARRGLRVDVLGKRAVVGDPGDPQCPPEGAAPHRLREAGRIGVHVRSPTRQSAGRIGPETGLTSLVTDRDDPQQLAGRRSFPAAHTGALRQRASYH
ncbi:hypothetical protein GCM10027186_45930 [Micromonospora schwarzwaldensis]